MKKLLVIALLLLALQGITKAQTYDSVSPYLRSKEIPSFNILQPDSTWYRSDDLPKKKSTVIIYFNPDCSHCQETAKHLAEALPNMQNITFIWVTYLAPLEEITGFMKDFGLSKFGNVHGGKDPQYFVPSFFRVEVTPFVALYNPKGKLVKAWPTGFTVKELEELTKG